MRSRVSGFALAAVLAGAVIGAGWRPAAASHSREGEDKALGIQCTPGYCGRLFVIAIGFNGRFPGGSHGVSSAEADAERVARRLVRDPAGVQPRFEQVEAQTAAQLESLSLPGPEGDLALARARAAFEDRSRDGIGSTPGAAPSSAQPTLVTGTQVALLTGDAATREKVQEAFARVAAIGRPQDALVVFYAGISHRVVGADSVEQQYLQLGGPRPADDSILVRYGVSAAEFGGWLSGSSIERQLVVLEAGSGPQFLEDFSLGIVERNEMAQRLLRRQRLVIAPSSYGLELRQGGPLAYGIARTARPLRNIWNAPIRTLAGLDDASGRPGYVAFLDERPILGIARALAAREASAARGVRSAATEAEPTPRSAGRSVALLVGTDSYAAGSGWDSLRNPIHDVTTIARDLAGGFGFDTIVLRNPTRTQILETLVMLSEREYGERDQLLFFAAGHGHYDPRLRMGYLVTKDSRPLSADRIRDSYISHGQLASYLDAIPVRHVLTVLDACFGGAFADLPGGGSRSSSEYDDTDLERFLQLKLGPQSRLYITSGGTEYVSDGRPGQHSPFAYRFIATLREARTGTRPLTIAGLRTGVEAAQPGPRSGEFGTSEPGGDFVLVPTRRPNGN